MLSEELKELIDASLTDGVLTDKERAVIRKKALLEGVDPDEVDILLDSEVQKIQQQKQKDVAKVQKCPNCGAVISGLEFICPECGYKITQKALNSSKELADKINAIMTSNEEQYTKNRQKAINQLIRSFPVPNTEEDLLEFLMTMSSNMKLCDDHDEKRKSYFIKYNECVSKIKVLFPNNPIFIAALKEAKPNLWQKYPDLKYWLVMALLWAFLGILGICEHYGII